MNAMSRPLLTLVLATLVACPEPEKPDDTGTPDTNVVDADGDGFGVDEDCDDADAAIHPGADEACNGLDDDCDGETDEGVTTTFYADVDDDGYGDPDATTQACEVPSGYLAEASDCDDGDATIHPGADEACDGVDQDCDGEIDEGVTTTFYADADGDGFGDAATTAGACARPSGFVEDATDCDDGDASAHPGAPEDCDGVDDDCDGEVDEGVTSTFWADADGDGYGDFANPTEACTAPSGFVADATDCDDGQASAYPGATERCDGRDTDFDGAVDEAGAEGMSTFYADADGDGYGDPATTAEGCTAPTGFVADATDCDDAEAAAHPGGTEVCDGLDNDCDGDTDEDSAIDAATWYLDADADGYGSLVFTLTRCTAPTGYVATSGDCDDLDADISPAATEVCDDADNDCDGAIDEAGAAGAPTWYLDADGDGYGLDATTVEACDAPSGYVADPGDCDDTQAAVNPVADELCDGVDNDCDGDTDEEDATDAATWYADVDGDGYGTPGTTVLACTAPSGFLGNAEDCDDTVAAVNPAAAELCNGADDDCDGVIDEDDATDALLWYLDADADGYGDAASTARACAVPSGYSADDTDCDDAEATTHPGAGETCDGLDQDCDGAIDEDVAWFDAYQDADGDGFGDPAGSTWVCDLPSGAVADGNDCDDADPTVHPGAAEVCDGLDQDCDGTADDGVLGTWYLDADADGYGDPATAVEACAAPSGYLADDSDCDDTDDAVHPGAEDLCDGIDNDCDGVVDGGGEELFYADLDGDGFGDAESSVTGCSAPSGYVTDDTDCDDTDASVYPGSLAPEIPDDGIDSNCDGNDGCTDLNCDGLPDLVFAGLRSGTSGSYTTSTYLYYSTGYGFSSSYRDTLSSEGASGVVLQDLDQDGYVDVLLLNEYNGSSYSRNSYVYYGSGSGYSSSDAQALPTVGALDAAVEDLDNDGWLDIVVANYYTGSSYSTSSYIYWGSALGYSSADRSSLATYGAYDVDIADLDEDGWLDLVFADFRSSSTDFTVNSYVYWGSSAGFSSSDRTSLATNGAREALITDVNNDGWLDIVFACYRNDSSYSTSSYVYYGSAGGYSSAARDALATYGAFDVAVADLNQDTYPDLVFANYYSGSSYSTSSYIYWGTAGGYSSSARSALSTLGARDVAIADFDQDGWDDLAFANYYNGSSYGISSYIYWNSASGTTSSYSTSDRTSLTTYGATRVAAADMDLDGWDDLVFNNYYTGSTYSTDSYVYYSTAGVFSASNRDDLPAQGPWAAAGIVGVD
ncbi:MAG: putative metal-binding motif-containing protein [Pseudomonadota bacterium]